MSNEEIIAIAFLDSIRDYERENGQRICNDERDSRELYEIFKSTEKHHHLFADLTPPTEIKAKLISEGWEENSINPSKSIIKKIGMFSFVFTQFKANSYSFSVLNYQGQNIYDCYDLPYTRIKAIVFGLTNCKI